MRGRTLVAIVLTVFALPALASDPPGRPAPFAPSPVPKIPASPDTMVAIADVRLDAAFDEKTLTDRAALVEEARRGYEWAIESDPKHKGALLGLARLYARTERRERAVEAYKTFLVHYPTDVEAVHEVALAFAKWGDWAGAVAWCGHALKIDPENRTVKKTLGFCLARAEKWDEAFAVLCRTMPEAQARHNLAGLLDHMSRPEASKEQLRLALRADPTYAPARAMLRELETAIAPPPHDAEPAGRGASVTYKLRNVAAADAASALTAFVNGQNLAARLTPEPVSNAVLVEAEPAVQRRLSAVLAEMDREPPRVVVRAMVIQVPRGFAEQAGLNVGGDTGAKAWTLSPREAHMFAGLIRAAKERCECDILARPMLLVGHGQTGRTHVGQNYPIVTGFDIKTAGGLTTLEPRKETVETGVKLELLPRIAPDGRSVQLGTNIELREVAREVQAPVTVTVPGAAVPVTHVVAVPTFTTRVARATSELKFGHTLVLAAARLEAPARPGSDDPFETLIVITPELVKPQEPPAPAAGWFLK